MKKWISLFGLLLPAIGFAQTQPITVTPDSIGHYWMASSWPGYAPYWYNANPPAFLDTTPDCNGGNPGNFNLTGINTLTITWSAPAGEMFVVHPPPTALGPLSLRFGLDFMVGDLTNFGIISSSFSFNTVTGTAPAGSGSGSIIGNVLDLIATASVGTGGASFGFTSATLTLQLSGSAMLEGRDCNFEPYPIALYTSNTSDPTDPGQLLTLQPAPNLSGYSVDWFKVAGGGGTSTGAVYSISGTFGQQDAGGPMQGRGFSVEGGFWSPYALQTPSATGSAPTISAQPQSQFVPLNSPMAFNVSATGTPTMIYQWQKNGISLTDGGNISGSLTTNLVLSTTSVNDAGGYAVIIENAYGNITSSVAKLTMIPPFRYTAVNLGSLGDDGSYAYGINNSGQVVGESGFGTFAGDSSYVAFLYSGGAMVNLGTLSDLPNDTLSIADGINNSGQVVGNSATATNEYSTIHAFLYNGGMMADLGTLGGSYSLASGINDSGQVVGYSYTSGDSAYHAFLDSGGMMADLGTLGGNDSYAQAINDSGQVVGYSDINDGSVHAFLYSGGTMLDLSTLGGNNSYANGINNSGQVVGESYISGNSMEHAFLYSGGTMADLGTLGSDDSIAYGINNSGQVVGFSDVINGFYHAFLCTGGAMLDLNNLLINTNSVTYNLYVAQGINDSNQIAANDGYGNAYLLTPVPVTSPSVLNNFLPQLQSVMATGGNVSFSWNTPYTFPPVNYQLQYATNLTSGDWFNLGGVIPGTNNTTMSVANPIGADLQRFYRIVLEQ